jgi:hypothetical protein
MVLAPGSFHVLRQDFSPLPDMLDTAKKHLDGV